MAKVKNSETPVSDVPAAPESSESDEGASAGAYKLNPRLVSHSSTEIDGVIFTHDEPVELTDEQAAAARQVKVPYNGELLRAVVKA